MRYPHLLRRSLTVALGTALLLAAASTATAQNQTFLWSMEDEDNTVYLLGSVHMLPESAYPLASVYDQAYADSEELVLELDLDPEQAMVQMFGLLGEIMLPGGQTLENVLSPEAYREVKEYLEQEYAEMPQMATMMERMRPWMIGLMAQIDVGSAAGIEAGKGVEMYFLEKATQDEKPVSGLETMQDQMAVFSEMSPEAEEEFLLTSIRGGVEATAGLQQIVDAWQKGESDAIADLLLNELATTPDLYERLLVRRNKAWVEPVVEFVEGDRNVLIVVGAGHLVGSDSLLELLNQRGYSFTRH